MKFRRIAIRYSILLWFAVVFIAYYIAFFDKFFLGGRRRMDDIVRLLDFGSHRVLSIDSMTYYFNVPCVYDAGVVDYTAVEDDEMKLLTQMKDLHISHVLINSGFGVSRQDLYNKLIEQGKLKEVFTKNDVSLSILSQFFVNAYFMRVYRIGQKLV